MEFISFKVDENNEYDLQGYGKATYDIMYDTKSEKNALDLYMPTIKKDKYPVVVFIHGGGFATSDKRRHTANVLNALSLGYAVAAVNFRLNNEAKYPAFLEDCLAALTFLGKNSSLYALDKDKMIIWGETHGAYLACKLGIHHHTTPNYKIAAIISFYAPLDLYDLRLRQERENRVSTVNNQDMDATSFGEENLHDTLKALSPLEEVTGDEPPFYLLHGRKDIEIPIDYTFKFFDVLKEKEVPAVLDIVEDGTHGIDFYATQKYNNPILRFMKYIVEK